MKLEATLLRRKLLRSPRVYFLFALGLGTILFGVMIFTENKAPADSGKEETTSHAEHEETLLAKDFGIEDSNVATTGPGELKSYLTIIGKVELDPNQANHLNPRYPGIVKSVSKSVGDFVKSGTRLATIESNVGLQTYHITSSIAGTVLTRDISIGEYVNEDTEAFSVANTDGLWVHLTVRPADLSLVKVGDEVLVTSRDGTLLTRGKLFYVSPLVDDATRTAQATLKIDNKEGIWRPGMFIDGHLQTDSHKAAVIAPKHSIFTKRDENYLIIRDGGTLELQEVDLGESDFDSIEVIGGLEEGETIVANITREIDEKLREFFEKEDEEHGDHAEEGEDGHDHD